MQSPSGESTAWPTTQWDLPAPDSYVLLNGVERADVEPFKLAIMELVGRRILRLVELDEPGIFGTRRHLTILAEGNERRSPTERSLSAVRRYTPER